MDGRTSILCLGLTHTLRSGKDGCAFQCHLSTVLKCLREWLLMVCILIILLTLLFYLGLTFSPSVWRFLYYMFYGFRFLFSLNNERMTIEPGFLYDLILYLKDSVQRWWYIFEDVFY